VAASNEEPSSTGRHFAFSQLLRWAGGLLLAASAGKFVITDLIQRGPLGQYGAFLGFTLLLALCGWFVTRRWRDAATGRALLGLAAGFVPAHFGQLGGMLYDSTWGTLHLGVPLWGLLAVAFPVLAGVTWLGMSSLCRSRANLLTVTYLGGLALLLPTWREPWIIESVTLGLLLGTVVLLEVLRRRGTGFVGLEGLLTQVAFFPAVLLLPLRQFIWHDAGTSLALHVLTAATLGYLVTGVLARGIRSPILKRPVEVFGLGFWFVGWAYLLGMGGWLSTLPTVAWMLCFSVPVVIWSLTRPVEDGQWLRSLTAILLAVASLALLPEDFTRGAEPILFGLGLLLIGLACHLRERLLLGFALLTVLIAGLDSFGTVLGSLFHWHWSLLGVAGLLTILFGAWLERLDARHVYRRFRTEWR